MASTPQEIASTPRPDPNLELLAVRLGQQIIAEQSIYDRVVTDIGAIRNLKPELADVKYRPSDDGKRLLFAVDVPTLKAMRDGEFIPWKCLNDAYRVESVEATILQYGPPTRHPVTLTLKGIYHLERLAEEYRGTLSVGSVAPYGNIGDGPTICVTREGDLWHYVISRGRGDCPAGCYATTAYYFSTRATATPTFHEMWDSESGTATPAWWTSYGRPNRDNAACPRPK